MQISIEVPGKFLEVELLDSKDSSVSCILMDVEQSWTDCGGYVVVAEKQMVCPESAMRNTTRAFKKV